MSEEIRRSFCLCEFVPFGYFDDFLMVATTGAERFVMNRLKMLQILSFGIRVGLADIFDEARVIRGESKRSEE